jgi:hypothetical protein
MKTRNWLSRDPIGEQGGLNLKRVSDDKIKETD